MKVMFLLLGMMVSVGAVAQSSVDIETVQQFLVAANSRNGRSCNNSYQCLPGENCVDRQCRRASCSTDASCAPGERCESGRCRP